MYNRLEKEYGTDKINNFMLDLINNYAYKEITTNQLVELLKKHYGDKNEILEKYIEEKYLYK